MATEPTPTDALLPCPFCGVEPTIFERPDNIDGTEFFCAFACYCGGYSACAHKMAVRKTPELAKADAIAAWNRRAQPAPAASPVLRWCTHCGGGVTTFCRSKCDNRACPSGLPGITKGAKP